MTRDSLIILTAQTHASLKTYCSLLGYHYAIPRWENLSDHDMVFAINITAEILENLDHQDLQPSDVHGIWLRKRTEMGYRLGGKRDRNTKIHPNMMPFELLSPREQLKSKIILDTIKMFGKLNRSPNFF